MLRIGKTFFPLLLLLSSIFVNATHYNQLNEIPMGNAVIGIPMGNPVNNVNHGNQGNVEMNITNLNANQQQNASAIQLQNRELTEDDQALVKALCRCCCCITPQLIFDFANCILPGYMYFTKAGFILVYSKMAIDYKLWKYPKINTVAMKFIVSVAFFITNLIFVVNSQKSITIPTGEYWTGEWDMQLYPNTDGGRALMIVWPTIVYVVKNSNDAYKVPLKESWYGITIEGMMQLANIFLPTCLPPPLFQIMFGLGCAQLFVDTGFLLFMFNMYAYCHWGSSEMNPELLNKSLSLLFFWIFFFLTKTLLLYSENL